MSQHTLTGFGFGPIQSGLFAREARRSGRFGRLVIAEVDQALVDCVCAAGGVVHVNVAGPGGIATERIEGVELYNPLIGNDRRALAAALAESTEIVTALPSVAFFDRGEASPAALIAGAVESGGAGAAVVYTAENNNHAAEILEEAVAGRIRRRAGRRVQFLNTVIGKMSQVVTDPADIRAKGLAELAPGCGRAHLVEEFNRILVTRCTIAGFHPGIGAFIEKDDLLPFEEAKLYGHNAVHALMGFLGALKGYRKMPELAGDAEIMRVAREAFIEESGAALIRKWGGLGDELFTAEGFKAYAEDLLDRIVNPYLDDSVERAARDPLRKLGPNDRIFGTMALCLEQGIKPFNFAAGAAAGITSILLNADEYQVPAPLRKAGWLDQEWIDHIMIWLWGNLTIAGKEEMIRYLQWAGIHRPETKKHLLLEMLHYPEGKEILIERRAPGITFKVLKGNEWKMMPNLPATIVDSIWEGLKELLGISNGSNISAEPVRMTFNHFNLHLDFDVEFKADDTGAIQSIRLIRC